MNTKSLSKLGLFSLKDAFEKSKISHGQIYRMVEKGKVEKVAARLAGHPKVSDYLIFKGGLVSFLVYETNRYTVDLDALIENCSYEEATKDIINAIEAEIDDGVWFHFMKVGEIKGQAEYKGKTITFREGIGKPSKIERAQKYHIDIVAGEKIYPPPKMTKTKTLFDENEKLSWRVYPVECTIAEKLHTLALLKSGNSRSKDLYDLYKMLPLGNREELNKSLINTFKARDNKTPPNFVALIKEIDIKLLKKGWTSAVASVKNPPTVEETWKIICTYLKKYNL